MLQGRCKATVVSTKLVYPKAISKESDRVERIMPTDLAAKRPSLSFQRISYVLTVNYDHYYPKTSGKSVLNSTHHHEERTALFHVLPTELAEDYGRNTKRIVIGQ